VESDYVRIAGTAEIPVGKTKVFKFGNKEVLIANVDGTFYAIGSVCTHSGGDLAESTLEGNIVTCPRHHAQFDIVTGKIVSQPKMGLFHPKAKDEPTYPVRVENENVMIKL
jgi:nitrite reductase/ring-hydroxylating ferredoxin subunit